MAEKFEKLLLEAAKKEKSQVSPDNPYSSIGFDADQKRLGWIQAVSFPKLKAALEKISSRFEGKDNFIFVGMGGSINGIKPLISIFKNSCFYTLDNLDPQALFRIVSGIKHLDRTMVISISKSGTTKETQLLTFALKELFVKALGPDKWPEHFIWLSDPDSFGKLNSLGWEKAVKAPIQIDAESDIGGRFSSPHTLIFLLPLFLLLERNYSKLQEIYDSFISLQNKVRAKAYAFAEQYKDKPDAYFSPLVEEKLGKSFSSWIVQLFQESLGSKLDGLAVKAITNLGQDDKFANIGLDIDIPDPITSIMSQMYFFQIFIAAFSLNKGINFVTQGYVEKYKSQMHALESQGDLNPDIEEKDIDSIIDKVKEEIRPGQDFLEVILYFYPSFESLTKLDEQFKKAFNARQVLLFLGSDWNHQSYQAAFGSRDTFYVLLVPSVYNLQNLDLPELVLKKNTQTLKLIAKATYLTIKDKSLLFSFSHQA